MHLIWGGLAFGQEKGEPHALMYARWDGSRWTEPVDVIVTGNVADIREPDGVVDDEGILHVILVARCCNMHRRLLNRPMMPATGPNHS